MWFLGAGASRAAGIKSAGDMICDSSSGSIARKGTYRPRRSTDIGEPAVQRRLQAHFDASGGFPAAGSESEYSSYFEATYHSPRDRRAYLDELIARGNLPFLSRIPPIWMFGNRVRSELSPFVEYLKESSESLSTGRPKLPLTTCMKIMISGAGNAGADHGRDDRSLDVDADDHHAAAGAGAGAGLFASPQKLGPL
ncbi:hypothetical protein [Bradyrhizobium sp. WSM2793]|uniref:hypothetical protein n=1 Tax=Bradyrhizobium sp. WSM2793 TaxID=1038866 RepID=UPI0012F83EB3|nr:hypothetical protein [Bradyrhizobium sp. WSM2793]